MPGPKWRAAGQQHPGPTDEDAATLLELNVNPASIRCGDRGWTRAAAVTSSAFVRSRSPGGGGQLDAQGYQDCAESTFQAAADLGARQPGPDAVRQQHDPR